MADASKLNGTAVYLTDARRVGIMLRDRRLTLREHAAITEFILETVEDDEFVLRATAYKGDNNYIKAAGKGTFKAESSKKDAVRFHMMPTELGNELLVGQGRPGIFDDFYDVSIGEAREERSSVMILVHEDVESIWKYTAK
ncbi:Hypothetical predicted protein [Lecanosticta acicola]|uniref:Uncharacterized protein n=1 Tax=Lecanosticta acicola TaxID=111012 RepID=A0AAI9EDL1_9PEZI|nr:Hypothetical predicted protein [Lecanosticta acicola]